MIRLHGKNDREIINGRCYYTDATFLKEEVRLITGREPFIVNVTTESGDPLFRSLSPMLSGEIDCYIENGRMLRAKSVEVAWQYSKIYSEVVTDNGEHKNILRENLRRDAAGRLVPSEAWLAWRDTAFQNAQFDCQHPDFGLHKKRVRRAYDRPSKAEFWWWDGEVLDAVTARQKMYATMYRRYVVQTPGFKRLQEIVANGDDLVIFDFDGYDWTDMGMTPADCVKELGHSFGHGLVINLLLEGHDPTKLVPAASNVQEMLEQEYEQSGSRRPRKSTKGNYTPDPGRVIHLHGDYQDKQLCDGPYFSLMVEKKGKLVPVADPILAVREVLIRSNGRPRFQAMKQPCVIFGDPLADVAGTPEQTAMAIKICREILDHTPWTIRLRSANEGLESIARCFSEKKDKGRILYGMTLDTMGIGSGQTVSAASELGQVLQRLQRDGFRTFAMFAPLMPQADAKAYAANLVKKLPMLKECEHVWAEMVPFEDIPASSVASISAKRGDENEILDAITDRPEEWQRAAEQLFEVLADAFPKTLRFLHFVEKVDWCIWEKHQSTGAILLGDYPRQIRAMDGQAVDVELVRPLNEKEEAQLRECKEIVQENLASFVAVGIALKTIRDRKLYRQTHATFEGYCQANFNFSYSYGFRLIKSAELVEELRPQLATLPIGNILMPTTESQARELMKVPAPRRVEVLKIAHEKAHGQALSAARIEQAALAIAVRPSKGKRSQVVRKGEAMASRELDALLKWLGHLKSLALDGRDDEIVRIVEKAEQDRKIVLIEDASVVEALPMAKTQTLTKLTINWRDNYDKYDWAKGAQRPMTDAEKANIEQLAIKILGLEPSDLKKGWGTAYPPGCFAQTVLHVNHGLRHRYSKNGKPVGLKIFNLEQGKRQWKSRLEPFYAEQRSKLPGLPNKHFQHVIAFGTETDSLGNSRGYLVQEWVEGQTLDIAIGKGLSRQEILNILDDLFLEMIIPTWVKGTKWWDARRSNHVLTPKGRLVMIDPDTLADYAAEISATPNIFSKRNSCNPHLAIGRYTQLIVDLAANCPEVRETRGIKSQVRKLCTKHLGPSFRCLYPLPANWASNAAADYKSFRSELKAILTNGK